MRWLLTLFFLLVVCTGYTQPLPSFKPLRYDENYAALKNETSNNFYRKLKYISLSSDRETYLSIGGEARVQYIYYKNDLWSDAPEATHGDILSRFLLHGDLHSGKHFRLYTELQSGVAVKKRFPGPLDDNSLELHQAFIDINTTPGAKRNFIIRLGRQELLYGSQRIVSVREGPNNRQSFDGAKLIFQHLKLKADLFYSHHVRTNKGFFNDHPSGNTRLWGLYMVRDDIVPGIHADVYYLGLYKRQSAFDDGAGREIRHSFGSRIWNSGKKFRYDLEIVYQFGKFQYKTINAYTASINSSYTFNHLRLQPSIGWKSEIISGDKRYNDTRLQTFNPLFPRGGYFGLAALIGPENLIGIHPSIAVTAFNSLNISFNYDILWRHSLNDGIYAPSNKLIYSGRNIPGKRIGNQHSLIFDYSLNRFFSCEVVFTWFKAGAYLRSASPGKDVLFAGFTGRVKF